MEAKSMNQPKFSSLFLQAAYTGSDRAPESLPYRKEGTPMKIVILRPPAVITPILRRMFGIRKEKKR